jgi:exopolysaccharide biosynthesis polyprenyl glycosylphosphotransferase
MQQRLSRKPVRFVVVGATPQGRQIVEALRKFHGLAYAFAGYLAGPGESPASGEYLGTWRDAREIAGEKALDLVIFALPLQDQSVLLEILGDCRDLDLDYEFVPDLVGLISHTTHMDTIGGVPIIRLREVPLAGWNGVVKRTVDIVLSGLALVLLSPLFLVIAVVIKLDSRGPVFYRQERMGRDKRIFRMVKFRSMGVGAEAETGPVWARDSDERRTRVGSFLREWSLDELPQLWNVLMGHMSLVGPRPERPYFVEKFQDAVPDYFDRHRVKSGVTGWAQVNGLRGNVPIEARTRYDLYYIENWSLWLDLRILLMTLRAMVLSRGA